MDKTSQLAQVVYEIAGGLKLAAWALYGLCGEEDEAEAKECFTKLKEVEQLASRIAFRWSRVEKINEGTALTSAAVTSMGVGRIALGLQTAAKAIIRLSDDDDSGEYAEPLEQIARQATALSYDLWERRISKNKEVKK